MALTVEELLAVGKRFVGGKSWQAALVLEVGTELAVAVNKAAGMKGAEKSELVCQTVLRLLDDAEKAEKSAQVESTVIEMTTTPKESVDWQLLKSLVKSVLPATLSLIVGAARGKFDLSASVQAASAVASVASQSSCLPPWLRMLCLGLGSVQQSSPQTVVQGPGSLRLAIPLQSAAEQPPKALELQAATLPAPQQ